jgi:hypothetical protein
MSFLSGILSGVAKFAIPIAANFLAGPAAGIATKLLQGIADSFLKGAKGAVNGLVDGLLNQIPFGLGSPLKTIAHKLIGGLFDKLEGGIDGGIAKLVRNLVNSVVKRLTGDGVSVAPPSLGSKERSSGTSMLGQIFDGVKSAFSGGGGSDSILNELSLPAKPGNPGANATDEQLLKYQEAMQRYNRMLTMITQLLQMQHEGKKSVIQNMRA